MSIVTGISSGISSNFDYKGSNLVHKDFKKSNTIRISPFFASFILLQTKRINFY